jgi:alginate O-acetyltransferase complex protein AlgJ
MASLAIMPPLRNLRCNMKPMLRTTYASFAFLVCSALLSAQDFTATVKSILEDAPADALAVQGADKNWHFLIQELKHLSHGDLAAVDMTKANKEGTDPVPVIAKYAEEVKALGVELLVIPVPPKASIYPEKLSDKLDVKSATTMSAFFAKLKSAGVDVLDLETVFKEERTKNPDKQLYCATDSHWSPYAAQLAAKLVADRFKSNPAIMQNAMRDLIALPEETLEFHGDLLSDEQKKTLPKEKLPMQRAGLAVPPSGKDVTTVESDPQSPVLVLGDSHLMVFRQGADMLARQAGFIDHLQTLLPIAVQEIAIRGGGADGPRVDIARTKDAEFWTKKKVAIWLFTARELTQGRWRELPAKYQKK